MQWQMALKIFTEISTWIVVPIILAIIFGKKLDIYYQTKPWIFIIFIILSFIISSFGIIKSVKKYTSKL
ncbi:MAG: AtpZ/AtpI family protein [Patescibacteria group bacterium]